MLGQDRALGAISLGVSLRERGFNTYVAGPPGVGKMSAVRAFLDGTAGSNPTPDDWCYVHNFAHPGEAFGLSSARGLQPDPIPLDVKVVLVGDPSTFYVLHGVDPDFRHLFKVRADFDAVTARTPESEAAFAAISATCFPSGRTSQAPSALALLIEEASRMADDQQKLSVHFGRLVEVIREAEHWATAPGSAEVHADDVRRAKVCSSLAAIWQTRTRRISRSH